MVCVTKPTAFSHHLKRVRITGTIKSSLFLTDVFKEEEFYEYQLGFAKMPDTPFKLMIETAGKQDFKNKTLLLEHIDVSP